MGSQAMISEHTANNKSYQFQASIIDETILAHDVHVLPWAPAAHLSGLRHLQARTGPLLLGEQDCGHSLREQLQVPDWCSRWSLGIATQWRKSLILYGGPVLSVEWAVPIDTFQSCGKSKPWWLWHLYGNCEITKQNVLNVGCCGPPCIAKKDRS